MATRPKTGEPRKVNQPLKIDRLPGEMHDRIQAERAKGKTWDRIEEDSKAWPEWSKVDPEVVKLFPGLKLPHSNLQRWYDIRVDQARKEVLAQSEIARKFAETFGEKDLETTDKAVLNAIRDLTFTLMRSTGDEQSFLKELREFGWILAEFKKSEVRQNMVELEGKRVKLMEDEAERKKKIFDRQTNDAAKKLGKGQGLTLADINRIRERTFGLPPVEAPSGNPA